MNTDLKYAIKQLRPIVEDPHNCSTLSIHDRVNRAYDALQRIAEAEVRREITVPEGTECTGPNVPVIYHCSDLNCPIHGERNRKQ